MKTEISKFCRGLRNSSLFSGNEEEWGHESRAVADLLEYLERHGGKIIVEIEKPKTKGDLHAALTACTAALPNTEWGGLEIINDALAALQINPDWEIEKLHIEQDHAPGCGGTPGPQGPHAHA